MQQPRTINVRVWREVHSIYKRVANKEGFILGDLVSAVLLESALNLSVVCNALLSSFDDIDLNEAWDVAVTLHNEAITLMKELQEGEEDEEKEEV